MGLSISPAQTTHCCTVERSRQNNERNTNMWTKKLDEPHPWVPFLDHSMPFSYTPRTVTCPVAGSLILFHSWPICAGTIARRRSAGHLPGKYLLFSWQSLDAKRTTLFMKNATSYVYYPWNGHSNSITTSRRIWMLGASEILLPILFTFHSLLICAYYITYMLIYIRLWKRHDSAHRSRTFRGRRSNQ